MERDPLYSAELASVLEEATTMLRHDVRNRLGSIRNMAFYLRRKLSESEEARSDRRIVEFLEKIEGEVEWIDELIEAWGRSVRRTHAPEPREVSAQEVLGLALRSARFPRQIEIEADFAEGSFSGDALELALAVRCLLENAAEAARGRVSVKGLNANGAYRVVVENDGAPFREPARAGSLLHSEKPGHLGLGLRVVRRIAARYGGSLEVDAPEVGARLCLEIPK
jgi:nitrogen fixation/metabolism regulation signal transduction histidine kinase